MTQLNLTMCSCTSSDTRNTPHLYKSLFRIIIIYAYNLFNIQCAENRILMFFFLYKDLGPLARSETVDQVNLSC
jgi:hypothetical protein